MVSLAPAVLTRLEGGSSRERADFIQSGYARSELWVLGASMPHLHGVVREFRADLRALGSGEIVELARELCSFRVMEASMAAFEILSRNGEARSRMDLGQLESLGAANDSWAVVDAFAVYVTGPCWREGSLSDTDVLSWTASTSRCWRRTALASTVALNVRSRRGTGDPQRTLLVAERLVHDRDPMVYKALSWALRSLVAWAPEQVERFVEAHRQALVPLVVRETTKKLRTGRK